MKFFIDTANIREIREACNMGMIDGVTTNPSLIAKEKRSVKNIITDICDIIDGPISAEIISLKFEKMLEEARILAAINDNVVIKIPMTIEGLKVVRRLSLDNIKTNMTLIFSPLQALMAAKAGATYVSPFLGRLDDFSHCGVKIIGQIIEIFNNYNYKTEIIVASVRSSMHVLESAILGADIATIPFKIFKELVYHPLTDRGIESFLNDWENSKNKIF